MKELTFTLSKRDMKNLIYENTCKILKKATEVEAGHIGGSLSMSQFLLPIIYFLEIENKFNYKLILSKGHASLGLYSIINLLNINQKPFENYCTKKIESFHGHTCSKSFDRLLASSGSLGHGLLLLWDMLTPKRLRMPIHLLFDLRDGELQEGTLWNHCFIFNMVN